MNITKEQAEAIRALLNLVHYDDLASKWLEKVPKELRP